MLIAVSLATKMASSEVACHNRSQIKAAARVLNGRVTGAGKVIGLINARLHQAPRLAYQFYDRVEL